MTSRMTFALLAVMAFPTLSACAVSKALVSSVTQPAPRENDPLPQALDLNAERTRKLYLIVVDKLRQQGSARAAIGYLDAYDRQYPADPAAHLLRAECLVSIGEVDEAAPVYRALLQTDYKPAANAGLGKVAIAHSDWSGAINDFQTAALLSPSTTEYVNDLAYAQMRAGQYDKALSTMRQASELDPDSTLVRNNLILCLQLSGQTEEADRMIQAISDPTERQNVTAMLQSAANDHSPVQQN
jgi:Flp pilus assembly protein TadD